MKLRNLIKQALILAMKNIFLMTIAAAGLILCSACGNHEEEFVIKGSTSQSRLNGNRVFLVPYGSKQIEDSIGVDSVVIENGHWEFRGHGEYLARVTIDKHVRYGTQDLLIVTEPGGEITIVIDSISSGGGTPQNEALQQWKDKMTAHNKIAAQQARHIKYLKQKGDTVYAKALQDSLKQFNSDFRQEMIDMAQLLKPGPARDLLLKRYGSEDK